MERYSRQIVLRGIGDAGQRRLRGARVSIVGVGGLGSVSALQLTAMGVGHLRLVDQDVVDITNLQRQILYDTSMLGYPKVEAASRKLEAINPDVTLEPLAISINSETADDAVRGVDVVIDGLDRLEPRYDINRACLTRKVPYIFGSALESYGNASSILPDGTPCLECIFGRISDEGRPTCETVGVYPQILAIIASIQVKEAINIILGRKPVLAGQLLFADIESMEFRTFGVERAPGCPACGAPVPKTTASPSRVVELCGKKSFSIASNANVSYDLEECARILSTAFKMKMKTDFAITIDYSPNVYVVLMKTGHMLIHGAERKEDALSVYHAILSFINDC
jgi:adenylyltransferase/sulfurtransferase